MAKHPEPKTDGAAASSDLEPTLVLTFSRHGIDGTKRHRVTEGALVLGRDTEVFGDALEGLRLAPRHAEVTLEGGKVLLRDLGSETGTRVNGEWMVGQRPLSPGDVIRLGDMLLVFAHCAPVAAGAEPQLIGPGAMMLAVRRSIAAVAQRKHSIVISGETGTGKEVVARLLHESSGRTGPFVAVNCGTFTEGLLASDLFGHVRGAFTGAVSEQQGLFRAASGGTLLLDEVAEIPLALQSSLLRVLEMQEVRPVGATRNIATDVRVVAAANVDLIDLVRAGAFRADLYSRLAQWTIRLPPLRDRREDIPALTRHLLGRVDGIGRQVTPDLAEALLVNEWPMNVRGLLNVLSIAVVSSPGEGPLELDAEVRHALSMSQRMLASAKAPAAEPEKKELSKEELTLLVERFSGKVAALARHLEVTRPKLYRMLWAHEIEPGAFRKR